MPGEHRLFDVDGYGRWTPRFDGWQPNRPLDTWGHIAAQCIGRGDRRYRLSTVYLEFENGTAAGAIVPPVFDDWDGVEYYGALATSPNRDYVRVPIEASPAIEVAPGYTQRLAADRGNRAIFAVVTDAVAGVYGKPFSDAVGSVVFGVALVATPVPGDPTADVLLARSYYDPSRQTPKSAQQMGLLYGYTFGEQLA